MAHRGAPLCRGRVFPLPGPNPPPLRCVMNQFRSAHGELGGPSVARLELGTKLDKLGVEGGKGFRPVRAVAKRFEFLHRWPGPPHSGGRAAKKSLLARLTHLSLAVLSRGALKSFIAGLLQISVGPRCSRV